MRKMVTKKLCRLALPLAGFFFYCIGMNQYKTLLQYPITYQVVCKGEAETSLTKEDYENIREIQDQEESPLSYALWRKTEDINADNPEWSRSAPVDVWKVRGSLEILFHEFVKLQEQDLQGCYLDAGTARELFGSTQVIGNLITCEGRQLIIRGILENEAALLVVRPEEKETTDRITLGKYDVPSDSEVSNFLMRFQIQGTRVCSIFLREILQVLLLLFPASLVIYLFRGLKGTCLRWILLLLLGYLLLRQLKIPETMIPDKWSNFQFWSNWWISVKDQIAVYMAEDKTGKELAQIACFLKGTLCSVISLFFWKAPSWKDS